MPLYPPTNVLKNTAIAEKREGKPRNPHVFLSKEMVNRVAKRRRQGKPSANAPSQSRQEQALAGVSQALGSESPAAGKLPPSVSVSAYGWRSTEAALALAMNTHVRAAISSPNVS